MAVAIEALTPEAQAVAARLHPAVKDYLERKAGAKAAADADRAARRQAKAKSSAGGQRSASRGSDPLDQAADFEKKLDRITPGRGVSRSTGGRLFAALFVGVLVLEGLSYALGQPFSYSLKGAGQKIGDITKTPYKPLYAGQATSPLAGHGL